MTATALATSPAWSGPCLAAGVGGGRIVVLDADYRGTVFGGAFTATDHRVPGGRREAVGTPLN